MENTNSDLNSGYLSIRKMINNLVPFPNLKMVSASFSPFIADTDYYKFDHSVDKITESVLSPNNYMIDFDESNNKSIAAMLSYWGDVSYSDIVKTFPSTKEKLNLWDDSNRDSLFCHKLLFMFFWWREASSALSWNA